jgi:hypothetical protein
MKLPLLLSGAAAVLYGGLFMIKTADRKVDAAENTGRAFNLITALIFAVTVSSILVASAAVNQWLGSAGLAVAAGLAGFADTHSAAISVASLVATQKITASDAVLPILIGLDHQHNHQNSSCSNNGRRRVRLSGNSRLIAGDLRCLGRTRGENVLSLAAFVLNVAPVTTRCDPRHSLSAVNSLYCFQGSGFVLLRTPG